MDDVFLIDRHNCHILLAVRATVGFRYMLLQNYSNIYNIISKVSLIREFLKYPISVLVHVNIISFI